MYCMNDYRMAIDDRDNCYKDSAEWNYSEMKALAIATSMVACRSNQMVKNIVDEVCSLNDCGTSFNNEVIQFYLWVLESNGYKEHAQKLRNLYWK